MSNSRRHKLVGSPFLIDLSLHQDRVEWDQYPFTIDSLKDGLSLKLTKPITFLVGENGSGKSTLLEALAWALGFPEQGGEVARSYAEGADGHALGRCLNLGWRQQVSGGYFLRAESFFNWVQSMEAAGAGFRDFDGRSPHSLSHGEAFLALFDNRFEDGIYLLDEPEAALSPARQLSFLSVLNRLEQSRSAQLIIATHSPILLAYPGACVLALDGDGIHEVDYRETEHFRLTRDFLNAPERYFRHLFADE